MNIESLGIAVLLLVAAVIGGLGDVAATFILKRGSAATALGGFGAALLGAFAWSEWFDKASEWGGELEGLSVLPAILGALILSVVQILSTRFAGKEEEAPGT